MIATRLELLSINPVFTTHLLHYQDLKYNPKTALLKEGQEIYLEHHDQPTKLTRELAKKLNKDNLDFFNQYKDAGTIESVPYGGFISELGLKSGKKNGVDYLHDLGETLEGLRVFLNQENLIILGEWPTPWLHQTNDHPPVKAALDYLTGIIDESFVGGFQLKGTDLIQFIPHLFWLTRCNAGLPDFRFTYSTSKTVFSLCKYGVLHIDFYDKKEQTVILDYFNQKGFSEMEYCKDPVDFS